MEFCLAFESVAPSRNNYLKCYFTLNALWEAPEKEKPLTLWRNISWKGPLEILLLNVGLTLDLNQVAQGFVGLKTGMRLLSPCWTELSQLFSWVKCCNPLIVLIRSAEFLPVCRCFVTGNPKLDTLFQMQPHKCWIGSKNCFPWPAGSAPANGIRHEGGICHHGCQLPFSSQVVFPGAAFCTVGFSLQSSLSVLLECWKVSASCLLLPAELPLNCSPTLHFWCHLEACCSPCPSC